MLFGFSLSMYICLDKIKKAATYQKKGVREREEENAIMITKRKVHDIIPLS